MPSRPNIPSSVRLQVAVDANHRCSYCQSPEAVGIPMVMEHIIPLSAAGSSDVSNLCLACYRCNEFKGAKVEALDPLSGKIVGLFNPRTEQWQEHFAWSENSLRIMGRTACGRATVRALRLNRELLIQARKIWMLVSLHPPVE